MGLTGQVIAVQANFYRVCLDTAVAGIDHLLCVRRARLKKMGQQVYVGDRVEISEPDWQGKRGAIAAVFPRRNILERPAIVNIDRLVFLFSLKDPEPEPMQISRFLVHGEFVQAAIVVCFNKCDLVSDRVWHSWYDRLGAWGYQALRLSIETNQGVEELHQHLKSGVTVLCGPSGVGKSSLINALIPSQQVRTGAVGDRLGYGKHTTRHVELFELGNGGKLADTPGFLQPSLSMAPEDLAACFPEIRQRLATSACAYGDCRHREEPHCQVRGEWERYKHYGAFWEEVSANHDRLSAMATPDGETKQKAKSGGKKILEPRLSRKKYRRESRRSVVQSIGEDLEGTGQS